MKRFPGLVLLLVCSSALLAAHAQGTPKNGEDVIRAMHDAYAKSWYKTLTFTQKTTNYKPDGTSEVSTWYESLSAPGRLRIDIDPIKDGNGILFVNDKQIGIKEGKVANSRERIHPLLLLGFDVYVQPVDTTVQKLEKLKFDLSTLHEDKWQGEAVFVVGAKQGDDHSAQFWVTKKNLLFVRLIQPGGKDGKLTTETQFNKYEKAKGGGWVSAEVIFMVDGRRVTTEEYTDIKVNVPLDDRLFDPAQWKTPKKIGEGGKGKVEGEGCALARECFCRLLVWRHSFAIDLVWLHWRVGRFVASSSGIEQAIERTTDTYCNPRSLLNFGRCWLN